jgi:hypothetical protein
MWKLLLILGGKWPTNQYVPSGTLQPLSKVYSWPPISFLLIFGTLLFQIDKKIPWKKPLKYSSPFH